MNRFAKVKENPDLVRDTETQAILNTNESALNAYKIRKQKEKEISQSMTDINNMKQDINELKALMQRILDKIG